MNLHSKSLVILLVGLTVRAAAGHFFSISIISDVSNRAKRSKDISSHFTRDDFCAAFSVVSDSPTCVIPGDSEEHLSTDIHAVVVLQKRQK